MRVTVNVDCTPEEARAFLGLPDVSKLNELLVDRVAAQAESNLDLVDPRELMNAWTSLGGMMREQFLSAMTAAVGGAPAQADKPPRGTRK
jgi:hypothetical protein